MRKYLFLLLVPVLCAPLIIDSLEIDFQLSNQEKYELIKTAYGFEYNQVPQNPITAVEVATYATPNLQGETETIPAQTALTIQSMQINDQGIPVFELENHRFVAADTRSIKDDSILGQRTVNQVYWTQKGAIAYKEPTGVELIKSNQAVRDHQAVTVSRMISTIRGDFALVEGYGYIPLQDLSESDNRMEAVQALLDQKYNSNQYSVYVKQLETGETAGIRQDEKMYSASVTKLLYLYYAQQQLDQGKVKLTDPLKYTSAVNDFSGAYDPAGSGSLPKQPNNKEYSLQEVINKTAKESDNVGSNLLGYYVAKQSDADFQDEIEGILGDKWNVEERNASSKMAGQMMEAIYDQGGFVLDSLSATQFDNQRIARDLPVKVAHKIGDAYDYKHDVAIVYADSPFVLSIFTNQSDYDTISKMAEEIYDILK